MKDYIKQLIKIKQSNIVDLIKGILCTDLMSFAEDKKYAFVFLAADYNNLGDIAITTAQAQFLQQKLVGYEVVCVKPSDTIKYCKSIKKISPKGVLITLIGGGNNGSLYEFLERPRRYIMRKLKKYKIVSFPQTVLFEDCEKALPYKNEFIRVSNKCRNLTLFARERYSFNRYKELGLKDTQICMCPDIVFSLIPPRLNDLKGSGIAIMLRNDIEKNVSEEYQKQILDYLRQANNVEIENMDTWGDNSNKYDVKTLMLFLEKLSHKRIAITDRLHGMLFCYITHTPCITIDSTNPKILSTYTTWLGTQSYIKMCKTNGSIEEFISEYKKLILDNEFAGKPYVSEYTPLIQVCKGDYHGTD